MWEILGGLLLGSAVSGILPLVNAELLVVAAAVTVPTVGVPLVAAASTAGQMLTKTGLFAIARWAPAALRGKARAAVDRTTELVANRGGTASSLVFASAAVGIPPFYGVSLAAGALGMPLGSFVVSGTAGRALRFGLLSWAASHLGAEAVEMFS